MRTIGLSPKAILAFLFPFIATCAGVLTTWIVDGTFDANAIRFAAAGLITSAVAALGAYVGRPGQVIPDELPEDPGTGPDES